MTHEPSWEQLADQLESLKAMERLQARWYADIGSEDYGIWLIHPDGQRTLQVRATFSLIAARIIEKLRIHPIPVPLSGQYSTHWADYLDIEESLARRAGQELDLSSAVPYGLDTIDRDAVDPCTRAFLEVLRRENLAFQIKANGTSVVKGETYDGVTGSIDDIFGAAAAYCKRRARDEIGARLNAQAYKEQDNGDAAAEIVDVGPDRDHTNDRSTWSDQKLNLPGCPCFANPFPDTKDPRHIVLAPYFEMMEEFRTLAEEYPTLSINWQAYFPTWSVWPPSYSSVGESAQIPSAPGAELHLQRSACQAAEQLLGFSGDRLAEAAKVWLTSGRDRWLKTEGLKPWEFWLHALREFWLDAQELVDASGGNIEAFDRIAEESGYLPGISRAVGGRVWALMVTQHKSLNRVMAEQGLSTGDEIGLSEEVAGWIQDGKITRAFRAFAYFCGVLATRRIRELEALPTAADDGVEKKPESQTRERTMTPLIELSELAKARIRAREAEADDQLNRVMRACAADVATAQRRFGGYTDLYQDELRHAVGQSRAHADETRLICAQYVFMAHANEYLGVLRDPKELESVLARSREAVIKQYGEHVRTAIQSKEAQLLERAVADCGEPLEIEEAPPQASRNSTKRGRRPNTLRRDAIASAINKRGDDWRVQLPEILKELDSNDVFLGDFTGMKIDLGDDQTTNVSKWEDLDLSQGEERKRIIDVLRKYVNRRT